jgi:uncharacterized protein YecE (DUF72 family)
LERYAQAFNACEINSSFYRPHKVETWKRWSESVPADFRFSVKAPKTITHEALLDCSSELLSAFLNQVGFLGAKLGPILFQLPPRLAFTATRARRFLTMLRKNFSGSVVWEPRHATWFVDDADRLLKEFQIARVAADPACVPAASLPAGHPSVVYFRLHGSPRMYYSSYPDNFLNALASQITELTANAQVWCIFDNTAAGFAASNALALHEKVPNSFRMRTPVEACDPIRKS